MWTHHRCYEGRAGIPERQYSHLNQARQESEAVPALRFEVAQPGIGAQQTTLKTLT